MSEARPHCARESIHRCESTLCAFTQSIVKHRVNNDTNSELSKNDYFTIVSISNARDSKARNSHGSTSTNKTLTDHDILNNHHHHTELTARAYSHYRRQPTTRLPTSTKAHEPILQLLPSSAENEQKRRVRGMRTPLQPLTSIVRSSASSLHLLQGHPRSPILRLDRHSARSSCSSSGSCATSRLCTVPARPLLERDWKIPQDCTYWTEG